MSKYAMAVVIEVGEQGADAAWEEASERLTGKQSAEAETGAYFLGDPFPIAEQDEYDSGEAARAILAGVAELRSVPVGAVGGPRSEQPMPEAGDMSTSDGLGADEEEASGPSQRALLNLREYLRSGEKEGLRNVVRVELEKAGYLI